MKKRNLALVVVLAWLMGCTTTPAVSQQYPPQSMAPQQSQQRVTYNNTYPGGGFQGIPGVDAIEIRPNLRSPGAQLWFSEDGRWDSQGGKFSLLFPNPDALMAWLNNGMRPSAQELRAQVERQPLCPASVGKGQKWLVWYPY